MKNNQFPAAIGIIITTLILLALNEFSEFQFIVDYALIFIIAGMFVGIGVGKLLKKRDNS